MVGVWPSLAHGGSGTMAFVKLFGDKLLAPGGESKPTDEVLQDKKAVAIYFSAHWCPPCRGFTPKLAEWFSKSLKGKGMEVVFVSSDKDDGAFKEYFGEMPWCALPYDKRDLKDALSTQFKVRSIPSLVILGPGGEVITTDGRAAVSEDPEGANFPWTPPTAAEKAKATLDALGPELLGKTGGKPIGLYFSAHWCPPCRGFTPKLAKYYKGGLKDKMEIIFVSSDRDQGSFDEYAKEMPWLALPFENRAAKDKLSKVCGVEGIPCFAVLSPDGSVLTTDGRSKVEKDPKGESFPDGWLPQPCEDVNDDPSPLNGEKCVLALGASQALVDAVKAVAAEYHEAAGKDVAAMPLRFFTAPEGSVTEQIRTLTQCPEGDKLILLDIPSDGAFYVSDKAAPGAADVKEFIAAVLAGTAEKRQLKKG